MRSAFSLHGSLAALLAVCCIGSAQAAVVFAESSLNTVVRGVSASAANAHYFTIDTPGLYRATLTDLDIFDAIGFTDPFDKLELAVTTVPASALLGPAKLPSGPAFFDFTAAAGSFAALVKASVAGGGFGFYQVQITAVPEPAVWLLLAGGLGLIGWLRMRNSEDLV